MQPETKSPFIGFVDISKSKYFFTERCTFWQMVLNILSIIFVSVGTVIEDIIVSTSHILHGKIEEWGAILANLFTPKMAYA